MWEIVLRVLASNGGAIADFFGEWTILLTCLVIVSTLDHLTRCLVA